MTQASRKKPPIQVTTIGSIANADFSGLAALLLRINENSLKVVQNEQQSRACQKHLTFPEENLVD